MVELEGQTCYSEVAMELQVGVKALLKNKEGKYLVLKRSTSLYPEAGETWDIPGGRIEVDTYLFENLKREIMEETKLSLVDVPKLLHAQDIFVPSKNRHVVRLTYTGMIEGEPVLDKENEAFEWLTKEEMNQRENLDPYLKEVIQNYL
jgi:8-oxo-dGTP pyrophosphatase MutT (NUDIX family)